MLKFGLCLLILAPTAAHAAAPTDGYADRVLRFSKDGGSFMVARCSGVAAGGDAMLLVVSVEGGALAQLELSGKHEAAGRAVCDPAAKGLPKVASSLAKKHGLKANPVRGGLSPGKDRYVLLGYGADEVNALTIEGGAISEEQEVTAGSGIGHGPIMLEIAWHPAGNMVVVTGARAEVVIGDESDFGQWESELAFWTYADAPSAKLSLAAVTSEIVERGKAAREQCVARSQATERPVKRSGVVWCDRAAQIFDSALPLAPPAAKAASLHWAARAHALAMNDDIALTRLEALARGKLAGAAELLSGLAGQTDLASLKDRARFKALVP